MCGAQNEGWLWNPESEYGINLPFPKGAVTHSSAHIDNVLRTTKMCLSLLINVLIKSTMSTLFISATMSVIDVLYTQTHPHHIRLRDRSSVRIIISYGVLTPADVTALNNPQRLIYH